jgi:hypothetical protein
MAGSAVDKKRDATRTGKVVAQAVVRGLERPQAERRTRIFFRVPAPPQIAEGGVDRARRARFAVAGVAVALRMPVRPQHSGPGACATTTCWGSGSRASLMMAAVTFSAVRLVGQKSLGSQESSWLGPPPGITWMNAFWIRMEAYDHPILDQAPRSFAPAPEDAFCRGDEKKACGRRNGWEDKHRTRPVIVAFRTGEVRHGKKVTRMASGSCGPEEYRKIGGAGRGNRFGKADAGDSGEVRADIAPFVVGHVVFRAGENKPSPSAYRPGPSHRRRRAIGVLGPVQQSLDQPRPLSRRAGQKRKLVYELRRPGTRYCCIIYILATRPGGGTGRAGDLPGVSPHLPSPGPRTGRRCSRC